MLETLPERSTEVVPFKKVTDDAQLRLTCFWITEHDYSVYPNACKLWIPLGDVA